MLTPASFSSSLLRLLATAMLATAFCSCNFLSDRILTKPVVQVEDRVLTVQDFSHALALRLKDYDALSAKDPRIISVAKQQILNDFVLSTLIDIWMKQNNLSLDQAALDATVKSYVSAYPADSVFKDALAESGQTYTEWVKKIADSLKKKKLLAYLSKGADPITENEISAYYNEHKSDYMQKEAVSLEHILVADENQVDIVKKLLKKQSFSEVAKTYSSAYTKELGDDYGWVEKDFSQSLEKAFKLRVGEAFGPIKQLDGLHLFKIRQRHSAKQKSLVEARADIIKDISALRETARFTAWLDEQIKKYPIKKNETVLNSVRIETQ